MRFKLEKPKISGIKPDKISKIFGTKNRVEILTFVKKFLGTDYVYWDKFRHKEPTPKGATKEELWAITKIFRESQSAKSIVIDKDGKTFTWAKLDYFEEFFHKIDMSTGGELFVEKGGIKNADKQKLISRGIMEEAIASSQLEGAATSRKAAKIMLREGRKPKNESEKMIVNNYISMKAVEEDYKNREMSIELIQELHSLITKDTVDSEGKEPRIRKKRDPVYVTDKLTGDIYHEGPDIGFVKAELEKLIKFSNHELGNETFIHPIIKAIIIHFWIGYLHPFTDGNGRLARLLFYWYLMRQGYWAFVYLPISKAIKLSAKQYTMAYVYSEQDDNDMTYFIDYNIKKIKLAVEEFKKYLEKKSKENILMKKKSEITHGLNDRQVQLLQFLHGDPDGRTTLNVHMNINQVTKMTANKDLKDLVSKDFLTRDKQGRNVYYYGTENIKQLF
ncbi:MAG: Fic family protein [bacterium]|nr:Fic family protein [bacterium]